MTIAARINKSLFTQVDASSLVAFRIIFGIILLSQVIKDFARGLIELDYLTKSFYFKYYGFEWVEIWPGDGIYIHFIVMGVLAVFIGIGFLYRLSTVLFLFAFSYIFLLDQALYLNHFYFVILVSFIMCIIPANRCFSVDARLRPKIRSTTVPAWSVWFVRAQFEIVLIYAGIVKINSDWLQLEPLRIWLNDLAPHMITPFNYLYTQDWAIAIAAYGVILLHIVGAPLLLFKRTRLVVFCMYACFHSLNHFMFNIGIFPWFTLLGSLIFFDPDWPKQLWERIRKLLGWPLNTYKYKPTPVSGGINQAAVTFSYRQKALLAFLAIWLAYQILFPLRHLLYPGNVSWTEEGHRYSWQMKLRDKQGAANFFIIHEPTKRTWYIYPRCCLSYTQVYAMAGRPDMILQFAHYLEKKWAQEYGLTDVEIYVDSMVSLNGRKPQPLVDLQRDFTKIERNLKHADWVIPLTEPLKSGD